MARVKEAGAGWLGRPAAVLDRRCLAHQRTRLIGEQLGADEVAEVVPALQHRTAGLEAAQRPFWTAAPSSVRERGRGRGAPPARRESARRSRAALPRRGRKGVRPRGRPRTGAARRGRPSPAGLEAPRDEQAPPESEDEHQQRDDQPQGPARLLLGVAGRRGGDRRRQGDDAVAPQPLPARLP